MSKAEFVDLSGLRVDGRRPHELRKISAKLGVVPRATGSVMLDHGHTKVLATVYGPRECTNRARERHDRSVVNCDVVMAPFAQVPTRPDLPLPLPVFVMPPMCLYFAIDVLPC